MKIIRLMFYLWIVVQLIMCSYAKSEIINRVKEGTYKCTAKEYRIATIDAISFPLAAFVPSEKIIDDYCNK